MNFASVPFDEAMAFFRQKVNLPTKAWTDLWEGMHARAFVVAGAMKSALLSDLRGAIDKAIADGTTITGFRRAFDETVQRNGWKLKGKRGWRTATIFDTNLRTAYAAGHYKQMTEPSVLKERPYWRYVGGLSEHPRPFHLKWSGMVLKADDPWWKTHYPPNGWGCKCKVVSHSKAELERDGREVGSALDDGTYDYTDKTTGEVIKVPNGVDPGWNYNVGQAAWGAQLSEKAMSSWKAQGVKAWERLTPGDYKTYNRPETVPVDKTKTVMDYSIKKSREGMAGALKEILGSEEKVFTHKAGVFSYNALVNAKTVAGHIDPERAAYLPFLPETMTDPYEVWLSFERHNGTGKVVLRQRIIKAVSTGDKEGMLVVTNAVNGVMEAWTVIPVKDMDYLNRQRVGRLIWSRK